MLLMLDLRAILKSLYGLKRFHVKDHWQKLDHGPPFDKTLSQGPSSGKNDAVRCFYYRKRMKPMTQIIIFGRWVKEVHRLHFENHSSKHSEYEDKRSLTSIDGVECCSTSDQELQQEPLKKNKKKTWISRKSFDIDVISKLFKLFLLVPLDLFMFFIFDYKKGP